MPLTRPIARDSNALDELAKGQGDNATAKDLRLRLELELYLMHDRVLRFLVAWYLSNCQAVATQQMLGHFG